MELISVIVPIYKVEQYLDDCVQSIVNQTYQNLEIILVDDGSPDGCPELCDEWAKKDSRIRVIHQECRGVSAARNAGLEIARGNYIGFVDSDDYIANDMYERLLAALKATNSKIAACLIAHVFDDGHIVADKPSCKENEVMSADQAVGASFYKKVGNAVWCKLYEKTVLDGLRFPVGEVNEDYPVMVPIIVRAGSMVLVNEVMYYYRKRAGSITAFGYATSRNARFMHKNLLLIGEQLAENNLKCKKSYHFFLARNAYDMALAMEKNKDKLDESTKVLRKAYRVIMRKKILSYLCSRYSSIKDKGLYILVLTNMMRPVYRVLNKSL